MNMASILARILLWTCYILAVGTSRALRRVTPPGPRTVRTVVVVGAFHNAGWFRAHAYPLAASGPGQVIFVADHPLPAPPGCRFVYPPRWVRAVLGRGLGKLLWLLIATVRFRADACMGYHIWPGAWSALLVARLLRRPACYQMTAGPVEVLGGGALNENRVMRALGRPSARLERLALALVREFDVTIVRGGQARTFLRERGVTGPLLEIPGSLPREADAPPPREPAARDIDLLFVGRLSEFKQPQQFVDVVAAVRERVGRVRAVMVGEGPEAARLRLQIDRLRLNGVVRLVGQRDEAYEVMTRARVFVLTSRSEGLSIAMAEAMAAGAVPVVADVGELGDLVRTDVTGYLVTPGRIDEYAERAAALLQSDTLWQSLSAAARHAALEHNGLKRVAARWRECWELLQRPARTDGDPERSRVIAAEEPAGDRLPRDASPASRDCA
jgi:glycosyltransferase involved in cell wall biosynthesis